jgi:3-deoxy-7-phosphoheptulonate synthase
MTDRKKEGRLLEVRGEIIMLNAKPYKLVSLDSKPKNTVVRVGNVEIGGGEMAVIGGPCSVESREQILTIASCVSQLGVSLFRGGAFKPRTSPYSFQGLGEEGLKLLAEVRDRFGLGIVTEVLDPHSVDLVEKYADMIQIGTRNMQNFPLLRRAGESSKPVLLKRGMAATLEEFLLAAEYILYQGNPNVILCERGIRTFSDHARFTLDLSIIPAIKQLSHLPIIVDPSHAAGSTEKVLPLARAGVAAGADGIMVEVHHQPECALCDGPQALKPDLFAQMVDETRQIAAIVRQRQVVLTAP